MRPAHQSTGAPDAVNVSSATWRRGLVLRRAKLVVFGVCTLTLVMLGVSPTLAATDGPGWILTGHTFPTNLVSPTNETEEVTVKAEGGTFTLTFHEGGTTIPISYDATAGEVQAALQELPTVGAGNISVVGGFGRYSVTFTGTLGNMQQSVGFGQPNGETIFGQPALEVNSGELKGVMPSAAVVVKTEGATSGTIVIEVFNVGAGNAQGPITVTDVLPLGVKAKDAGEVFGLASPHFGIDPEITHNEWHCTGNGPGAAPHVAGASIVTCMLTPEAVSGPNIESVFAGGAGAPTPSHTGGPNIQPKIAISVEASGEASGLTNQASIAGGGALTSASTRNPVTVGSLPAPLALESWDAWFSNADGTIDTQAGSHPYSATFTFDLASALDSRHNEYLVGGEPRNIEVRLPPGLIGNPHDFPQCRREQLDEEACPQESQVGYLDANQLASGAGVVHGMFNMIPPAGVPAEFGFDYEGTAVLVDASVRSGGDYGVTTRVRNIPQQGVGQTILTLWGVPSEKSHNRWRGGRVGGCFAEEVAHTGGLGNNRCAEPQLPNLKPFLTLPTSCGEPQPFHIRVLSGWQNPDAKAEANVFSHDSNGRPVGFTGCEDLAFGPLISATPGTTRADTATGLKVEVVPPVGGLEEPGLLGTSDIQGTTVTLPSGVVINPGQAAGLQACQESEAALTTTTEEAKGEENDGPAHCPPASKVGTISATSPLIESAGEKEFKGNIYVLQSNPPHIKLLVAPSADGVYIKQVLNVELNEATGQLTTKVHNFPQDPVSNVILTFNEGAQAALATPTQCGTYTIATDFTPWSSPFKADALPTAQFAIQEGSSGGTCPSSPLPFGPQLTVGSTSDLAGGYTGLSLLLQREDGSARIEKLQVKAPLGLAGIISEVPLCTNAQAEADTCPDASQIGHAVVKSGPGPYPLVVPQPGQPPAPIYLTEGFGGAPFGLLVKVPLVIGPFTLETQKVRSKIEIDPHSAQVTVTTNPLPSIIDGVPTDVRSIEAIIDKEGFLFNPTNCDTQGFSGTAWGTPPPGVGGSGAHAPVSSRFGIGGCQALKFAPRLVVSTGAHSSKVNGASLLFKITYPAGAVGSQAWVQEAKFDIPKQLPARLTTIQKACVASVFESNPAACPPGSLIGHAVVHTPVLPVPLMGPVYFVSHGGAKFPDAVVVLQGDGVTVDLRGETFISGKTGITSATFRNTPDVPFERLEVAIPSGPHSEFAAHLPAKAKGNLCGQKLLMPTYLVGKNGLEIRKTTSISVTGCVKAKKAKKAKMRAPKRGKRK